jgi:hypothetical protein
MKYLIIILTILSGFRAVSQDPALPQERVTIMLNNGKTLKDVRLWTYSNGILEYESNQVLNDIRLMDIKQIKGNFIYQISDSTSVTQLPGDMNPLFTESDSTILQPNNMDQNFTKEIDITSKETGNSSLFLVETNNYFILGQSDAKKYYKKGSDLKVIRRMAENPNLQLLQSNGEYNEGFMNEIKRQKRQSAIITILLIIFPILIIAAAA